MKKTEYTALDFEIAKNEIAVFAEKRGKSVEEYRQKLQERIDAAYRTPKGKKEFQKLFGDRKPTVDEYIITLSYMSRLKMHLVSSRIERETKKVLG